MNSKLRLAIALILILSIFLAARSQVAWAGETAAPRPSGQDAPVPLGSGEDARKGTVQPPHPVIIITKSGTYTIGAFCTIIIEIKTEGITAVVDIERPIPRPFPDGVHKVSQGCRVAYYMDNEFIPQLLPADGNATVCFSAQPKKDLTIYMHKNGISTSAWEPIATSSDGSRVCANASWSATYIATFKEP